MPAVTTADAGRNLTSRRKRKDKTDSAVKAVMSGEWRATPEEAGRHDAHRLLSSLADALNACETAGITVDLAGGAVMTSRGYVMAVGDVRLGRKWQARTRLWTPLQPPGDSSDED